MTNEGIQTQYEKDFLKLQKFLILSYGRVSHEQTSLNTEDADVIKKISENAIAKSIDVVGSSITDFKNSVTTFAHSFTGSSYEFVNALAKYVAQYFLKRLTLQEITEKIRSNTLKRNELIGIGEILCYKYTSESTISLHLTPLLSDDPNEFRRVLRSDIKSLVDNLQSDPKANNIQTITVESFIVKRMERFFRACGFLDFEYNEQTNTAKATAQKEMFFKKIAEKSTEERYDT